VIGYLHLVLLGVISLFLLGYMITENFIKENRTLKIGIVIFACGVILNEVILMTQGITALDYYNIPYINEMLLGAALVLFTGALFMALSKKGTGE
jgi:C4-dicarboxylate transporter